MVHLPFTIVPRHRDFSPLIPPARSIGDDHTAVNSRSLSAESPREMNLEYTHPKVVKKLVFSAIFAVYLSLPDSHQASHRFTDADTRIADVPYRTCRTIKSIDLATKSFDLMTKSIHFTAKSLD
jgi:hypothetical protein